MLKVSNPFESTYEIVIIVLTNFSVCIGGSDIYLHLEKLETGYFGIAAIGKSYLIAGVGRAAPGLLKSRLQQLSQYFSKVFEQIK